MPAVLSFDRLAAEVIRPALSAAGLEWHGFHAFRRGLATNLYEMDLPSKLIQAILRHSNVATTERIYVKARQQRTAQRMRETMEQAFEPDVEEQE